MGSLAGGQLSCRHRGVLAEHCGIFRQPSIRRNSIIIMVGWLAPEL
jgi:hypothetical protein